MSYGEWASYRGRRRLILWFGNLADYVNIGLAMSPLLRYMRWYASRTPDELYLLTVEPGRIGRLKLFPQQALPVTGSDALWGTVGGPWDRLHMSVENHYFYRSIHDHLESDVPWEETQLYRHPKYRGRPEKARRRCEKIEQLIESIRKNGYRRRFDPGTPARELEPGARRTSGSATATWATRSSSPSIEMVDRFTSKTVDTG